MISRRARFSASRCCSSRKAKRKRPSALADSAATALSSADELRRRTMNASSFSASAPDALQSGGSSCAVPQQGRGSQGGAGGAGSCGEGVSCHPSSVGSSVLNGAHTHLAYDLVRSVCLFFRREHELEVDLHLAQVLGAIGERNGHLRERAAHVSCETDCCSSEEQGQPARERQWRVVRAGRSGEDRAVWRRRGRSKRLRSR